MEQQHGSGGERWWVVIARGGLSWKLSRTQARTHLSGEAITYSPHLSGSWPSGMVASYLPALSPRDALVCAGLRVKEKAAHLHRSGRERDDEAVVVGIGGRRSNGVAGDGAGEESVT